MSKVGRRKLKKIRDYCKWSFKTPVISFLHQLLSVQTEN